jgi:hypothetical protein
VRLAHNLSTYASPLPTALWQSPHTPRLQPPLHSVHLIPEHQKLDSRSMPVPVVKSSVLPVIHVPVRLQYGECAHYSIGAVLCSDRISDSIRASYPPVDHGLLILTNRRVLYLGKRCQFTLAYTHLWYVSLLHSALALHIQGQFRRVIMEVEHSREWASRIELLSFIARRSRPGSEPPTQTVPALPRLDLTVKRRAIRPRLALDQTLADNPTLPLLTERVESKIVEATTIEIDDPVAQEYADHTTLDLPGEEEADLAPICSSEPIQQVVPQTTASSVQSPEDVPTQELLDRSADVTTLPTQEFASSEDAPTQELSDRSDLTMVPTQEFAPQEDVSTQEFTSEEDEPTQELAALSPEEDAPTQELATLSLEEDMPTQELAALSPEEDMPTQELASLPPEEDTPTQKIRCQTAKVRVNMRISAFLDENDDRTIHLRERRLSQARTLSQRGRTTNKLSALTASPRASRRRR